MEDYNKQANDFAAKIELTMSTVYVGHTIRLGDWAMAQYRVTLKRGGKEYSFDFSQSLQSSWRYFEEGSFKAIAGLPPRLNQKNWPTTGEAYNVGPYRLEPVKTNKPTVYDILACLTKYDPGTFKDFCADYGYSDDSIKARDIYFAVQDEYSNVVRLFGDVMDELQEIN